MTICAVPGCELEGAFRTTKRPTWCEEHLKDVYWSAGLILLEPFTKREDHLLTRCTTCGFEGHYRFEYVLDRNEHGEATCRACYWTEWAKRARNQGPRQVDIRTVKVAAEANGYEYLRPLTSPSLEHDPHATKCKQCGRIEAQRPGDIGWGCPCSRNPKSRTVGTKKPAVSNLLSTSSLKVVSWWDHERNPEALWKTAKIRGTKQAWWKCQEGHSFSARIIDVTGGYDACPTCRTQREEAWNRKRAQYDGLTVADVPELLAAWRADTPPDQVLLSDTDWRARYNLQCPQGHIYTTQPLRWLLYGCPFCKASDTKHACEEAYEEDPTFTRLTPEIASQWHPTKNPKLSLGTISPESRRKVWWLDPVCGHEFVAMPRERDKYQRWRCQECETILDSLAYHYPEIAEEWAEDNEWSPWQILPNSSKLKETPLWQCREDPSHQWRTSPANRINGSGCPMCRTSGKSFIELEYARAAENIWPVVESGQRIHSKNFANHASWSVDILATTSDHRRLAIEYDGAYWHQDKTATDREKSLDLLREGCVVWRLRESPLPSLDISDPNYHEMTVYVGGQQPAEDLAAIAAVSGR